MAPRLPADYLAARARLGADHAAAGRRFPPCDRCGLALTLGQTDRHWACRAAEAVEAAAADHAQWEADGSPEPEPPVLIDYETGEVLVAPRPVADVPTGRLL